MFPCFQSFHSLQFLLTPAVKIKILQLIVTTPIQAVKLLTTMVTRLLSSFDKNELERGILAIKKTSVKTLQIGLYSVLLNVPIKHVQEKKKKFDCKRKRKFFYLNFSSIATLKKNNKDNSFLCQLCFLCIYLFWLTPCIFDFFYCEYTSRS